MVEADVDAIIKDVENMVLTGRSNPYEVILMTANRNSTDWMEKYGLSVSEEEKKMMRFWFSLTQERLVQMADQIIKAFLHGFISQSRERGNRRHVRLSYQLGQEALARQLVIKLKEKGMVPVVTKPGTMDSLQEKTRKEAFADLCVDDLQPIIQGYKEAMKSHRDVLLDTCGMIGIGQFGKKSEPMATDQVNVTPSIQGAKEAAGTHLYYLAEQEKISLEGEYIKPSEISFCRVAFPDLHTGEYFEDIFQSFFQLYLMDSEPYELAQQTLIDSMDRCSQIELKGCEGNLTNLTVSLFSIEDEERQTKFLNCGGDLNIPFGEVFTTPKLTGTNGLLHIPSICLKGMFYHELKLWFEEGIVKKVECLEGEEYVRNTLFQGSDYVPVGEFAIGTNTYAYRLARKYELEERLPILISEKTGPHLALGDSCFAKAEQVPVYNMYDKKEMVCRENEGSFKNGGNRRYCGFHVDITLPYGQIEYVRGRTWRGEIIPLIKMGKFVVEGAKRLNLGLEG